MDAIIKGISRSGLEDLNLRSIVATLVCLTVVYALWRGVATTYVNPPLWIVAASFLALGFTARLLPVSVALWWMAGMLTLVWSLTPGNTLVNSLWEVLYLAALAAGLWRPGFWILNVILLHFGLEQSLLLNVFGLEMYVSGSIHYVMGAQALVLIPVTFYYLYRAPNWLWSVLCAVLLVASTYGALMSGARAVYIPLLVVFPLTLGRLAWQGVPWKNLAIGMVGLAVLLVAIDFATPSRPMQTALNVKAIQANAEVGQVVQDVVSPEGNESASSASSDVMGAIQSRLLMWDQTFDIALDYPLGTGTGSFRYTIHALQKYPSINFASPHNYYLETLATGGWLRLALLLALLVPAFWRAWRSPRDWPWALAALGIWMTLAFDVTGYYPSFMMLAFWTVGAMMGRRESSQEPGGAVSSVDEGRGQRGEGRVGKVVYAAGRVVPWMGIVLALGLGLWWYLPCQGSSCAVDRYLGVPFKVLPSLQELEPAARDELLDEVQARYPKSLWVWQARQRYAESAEERLAIAREIAERFPLVSPVVYLEWAGLALELDRPEEARWAVEVGLDHFPPDLAPAGIPLVSRSATYGQWLSEAQRIKELTE